MIHYTSTRNTILNQLAQAGNRIGDVDASGKEGAESRMAAAMTLTAAFQTMMSELLHSGNHADAIPEFCNCLSDFAEDHFYCLTKDFEDVSGECVLIDPNDEHRLSARQLGTGSAA